ncbi:MAG: hypothetical protein WCP69_13525 [Bacteroidota bacterium]
MKTKLAKLPHFSAIIIILFVGVSILSTSCIRAVEGLPGKGFISLVWNNVPPTYIDAGTQAIPSHFEYDRFYRISPGTYHLYYEGTEYYNGHYRDYAWDMDYDIFVNPGGYNGYTGADTYFTLSLNPYGPEIYESYDNYKSTKTEISGYKVIEYSAKKIILERKISDLGIRVTYTKVK